ncbi:unnamed protein product [Adineta steineri]|uniref:Uncharacterized protein n=1 Tax=Adineta steineri TaxID=433720 RepID=A0A819QCA8_9BILA|nr:unnamed protein product [Adineta steineri]CAF4028369.1 unnamed protein product [Adineta steineri]
MTFVYNTGISIDSDPNFTTFLPCCNAPISVDYQPRHYQEIYYAPEPPPQIQVVRQRLPDPPPDVIERVVVVPQPKQYVYQVVEVPTKPPPVIQERVVHQSPNAPVCGGTYRVQVPPKGSVQSTRTVRQAPTVVKSQSYTQAAPNYVQATPNFVQSTPSYIQAAPTYIQGTPSYIQSAPNYIQAAPSYIQSTPSYLQPSNVVYTSSSPQIITL